MTEPTAQALTSLASRLTKQEDRETYAALISYFQSLPNGDELFRIVELLGLLSLLGQRLPDALAESMAALQEQAEASAKYYALVNQRLAKLPDEIAVGVNVAAVAQSMSEAFRQQLASAGLESAAFLLRSSTKEIAAMSNDISAVLKPAAHECQSISAVIASEVSNLLTAATDLRHHNSQLVDRDQTREWLWQSMLAAVLFLSGMLCGVLTEKRQTTDALLDVKVQMERFHAPVVSPVPPAISSRRKRTNIQPYYVK